MGIVLQWPRHARASLGIVKRKTDGSTSLPQERKASAKTKKCSAGMWPREIQFKGADTDRRPANSAAAAGPPTDLITSETEFIIAPVISHGVTMSSNCGLLLGNPQDSAFNHGMATKVEIKKMMAALQKYEAARLDMAQIALKLTNEALAEKIGITQQAWSQYRTGERPIPKEALYMLHRDYAITVQYILFDDRRAIAAELSAFLSKRKSA